MKAVLKFKLPKDNEEFEAAKNGMKNQIKIDTIYDMVFRPHIKYDHPIIDESLTERDQEVIFAIWKKLSEHLGED